ncbi:hypothetical protein Moror_11828 [Moniliophthora roreri MCA 2997]|uniref:Uncharacterized protein n=2 Tax=Moniliophthora roreri TaxID=221103 RepID=V2WQW2_MONRO|nr:hypothetical protein Moror_11828 [Moniliophthora roreri MCA 2997]
MSFFSMPKVYVIPPEEDDCPPFCCFDATQSTPHTLTQADLEAPGSALDIVYHAMPLAMDIPTFYRKDIHSTDVVMPRRRSTIDNHGPYNNDITVRGNSPGDDSEIIEVIKVRRNSESQPVTESVSKQSKGFKARASKAFSSMRNVGRSASRNKKKEEMEEMEDSEYSRAPSPTPMSRRPSMILTNLFSRSPSLRTSSSFDSFAESSSPSPASPLPTPPDTISTSSSLSIQIHNPPSADMHSFVPYSSDTEDDDEDEVYDPDYDDPQATPRAHRPTSPTSQSSKSGRRRFSVMNLFSLASSQPIIATSPSTPILPVMSRDSTDPSSESTTSTSTSSTGPPTPVDEPFPPPRTSTSNSLLKRVTSFSKRKEGVRKSQSLDLEPQSEPVIAVPSTVNEADLSFGEMRLDSLHFSELSFDADKFEIR